MNPLAPVTATRPLMGGSTACRDVAPRLDWLREERAGRARACYVVVHVPSVPSRSFDRVRSRDAQRVRDRKSTRLNSSHVRISYAVFCLKKKKTHATHFFSIKKKKKKTKT